MKNIILASSSSVHGSGYLEYLEPELKVLFEGVTEVLFIPYARPSGISHQAYTDIAAKGLSKFGIVVKGIHEFVNPKTALENAKAIFVGGGNTFVLVATLYELEIMQDLRNCIESGIPYLGTSAGSNICGITMQTTNDMPIKMPKSFKTLGVIPFNINAHFIEADKSSTHQGETRETRIKEYHVFNETAVIGFKEGSWLRVLGNTITLEGELEAILFEKNKSSKRISPKTNLNH